MSTGTRRGRLKRLAILQVIALASMLGLAVPAAQANVWLSTCDDWQSIFHGKYYAMNNRWGHTLFNWGYGWQCVGRNDEWPTNAWQTDLSWTDNPAVQWDEYHIKAFPNTIVGWSYGYNSTDHGGLPVRLGDNKTVLSSWSWDNQLGPQKSDAVYDLWADASQDPSAQPSDEIMVFLDYTDGAHPDSGKLTTINVNGADYDVYRSTDSWQVISFVRTATTRSSTNLNLQDFLNYAVRQGWLDPNKYLVSIDAGFEIWHGAGKIITTNYNVDVS